ncbi:MAG: D-amino acid aminotransferase [Ruminococcaceae bacterium]|nr:D-amino acid aminotransferase [Oscillospiraceae bacterium]
MKTLGYYNGSIAELDCLTIPVLDRACYFGDGVYDVTYSRNYRVFAIQEHLLRLFQSADIVGIRPRISPKELSMLICSLLRRMHTGENRIYIQFSRGTGARNHIFPQNSSPNLLIMMEPATLRDPYKSMKCITRPDTRFYHCNVKSLNLLPNVLASEAAARSGADECILLRGEIVTECAHSNLFLFKSGRMLTHPADEQIYAGTGRAHLMNLCRTVGIPVEEQYFSIAELKKADEVLVTSASVLCAPVTELNGVSIGKKAQETVRALQDALLKQFYDATNL